MSLIRLLLSRFFARGAGLKVRLRACGFLFLTLVLSGVAAAEAAEPPDNPPEVVLLTSVKSPRVWYRPEGWQLSDSLEKRFRKAYGESGFGLRVVHEAGPRELAEVLKSPATIGVFWVSHSGSDDETEGQAARWDDVILDVAGNDVKELFQRIHPNIRWLGIVGCNAERIFEGFRARGHYRDNPELRIHSFDSKVEALSGLSRSLRASAEVLGDPEQTEGRAIVARPDLLTVESREFAVRRGFPLRVTQQGASDLVLLWDDRFLGILPGADSRSGEPGAVTVYLDEEAFSPRLKIKAVAIRGLSAGEGQPHFELRFDSALEPALWQVFSDAQGQPIGTGSRLYRYRGEVLARPEWFVEWRP